MFAQYPFCIMQNKLNFIASLMLNALELYLLCWHYARSPRCFQLPLYAKNYAGIIGTGLATLCITICTMVNNNMRVLKSWLHTIIIFACIYMYSFPSLSMELNISSRLRDTQQLSNKFFIRYVAV